MEATFQEPPVDPAQELKERIDTAAAVAYGQAGFVKDDGAPDRGAIADTLAEMVSQAVARKKTDRSEVGITRRAVMQTLFPHVVGPEGWADEDDPALAEGVYMKLNTSVWRLMDEGPDGPVQARLNGEHGLVLCHTRVNPHRTEAVYSTRDLACLLEDGTKKVREDEKKRADKDAAYVAMLIERVPEHGKRFNKELVSGLTTALNSAKAITAGALAALDESDVVE
jgi:hypothetical protein